MAVNYGKAFEAKFKEDFLKVKGATIDRLYDPVGGFSGIKNICDFIGFIYPNIFYLECKTHTGNTFPLTNLSQYDKLIKKAGIEGVRAGVVVWFYEKDKVLYIPIETFRKLKEDGKKSYNIKMIEDTVYKAYEIPGKKKRTYLDSDYSILKELKEGD